MFIRSLKSTIGFGFFLVLLGFSAPTLAASKLKLQVGEVPPPYLGRDRHNQKFNLDEHRGKVVVISFWASWCAPCRAELPVLNKVQEIYGKDKLQVVAVNYKEDKRVFRRVKKQLEDYVLTITRDKAGSIGKRFGVKGIPHLLIIGKDGKIAYQVVGYGTDSIDKMVETLNKELQKPLIKSNLRDLSLLK